MIHIPAKQIETEDGPAVMPAAEIPSDWKVRYIDGEFQAIPPGDEWPA